MVCSVISSVSWEESNPCFCFLVVYSALLDIDAAKLLDQPENPLLMSMPQVLERLCYNHVFWDGGFFLRLYLHSGTNCLRRLTERMSLLQSRLASLSIKQIFF